MENLLNDTNLVSLLEASTMPDNIIRHKELLRILERKPDVFTLLYSILLSNVKLPTFNLSYNNKSPNNTFLDVLTNMYYLASVGDVKKFKKHLKMECSLYQKVIKLLLNKTLLQKIPELILLDKMPNIYSENEISTLLPIAIKHTVSTDLFIREDREDVTITYPLYLLGLHTRFSKGRLFYLTRKGNTIRSNCASKTTRGLVASSMQDINSTVVFTTHNIKGKIFQKGIKILLQGNTKECLSIFKGVGGDINKLHLPSEAISINSEDELVRSLIHTKPNNINYLLSSDGIVKVLYKYYLKIGEVIDFVLNDSYEPVGLIILLNNETYSIKVSKPLLRGINITNTTVKLKVTYFLDKVISVKFIRFRK